MIFISKGADRDPTNPRSYRPISLTSFLFKTQERLNEWWCKSYGFDASIHDNQHAFRKGHSTELALSKTVNMIERGLDSKEFVITIFCDIKGVFDNVKSDAIIEAMKLVRVPESVRKWYGEYLKNRVCTTTMGNTTVTMKLEDGTPQGGVLSPPLGWNTVINRLITALDKHPALTVVFADDCSLTIRSHCPLVARDVAQSALDEAVTWASKNGLSLCANKTAAMFFTRRREYKMPGKLTLYGKEIEYVTTMKYLGVTIDNKLSWNQHIDGQLKKAKRLLSISRLTLSKLWGPCPKWIKWTYTGIVRPCISYAALVWAEAVNKKGIKDKLNKVQRLAMLPIAPVRRSTPTQAMEIMYGLMPLDMIIKDAAAKAAIRLNLKAPCSKGHLKHTQSLIPDKVRNKERDSMKPVDNWEPGFKTLIGDGSDIDPADNDWTAYTDGSLLEGRAGAGGVILRKGTQILSFCKRYLDATVFQAELLGIKTAAEALSTWGVRNCNITILIDNQASIRALSNNEISSKSVRDTLTSVKELAANNNLTLRWVKAHVGNRFNEEADTAAKEASRKPNTNAVQAYLPTCTLNQILRDKWNKIWKSRWDAYDAGRQSKLFLDGPFFRANALINSNKSTIGRFVRFITGHAFIKWHNEVIKQKTNKPSGDTICRICGSEPETAEHIITRCPVLVQDRVEILGDRIIKAPFHNFSVRKMIKFLGNPKIISLEDDDDEEGEIM